MKSVRAGVFLIAGSMLLGLLTGILVGRSTVSTRPLSGGSGSGAHAGEPDGLLSGPSRLPEDSVADIDPAHPVRIVPSEDRRGKIISLLKQLQDCNEYVRTAEEASEYHPDAIAFARQCAMGTRSAIEGILKDDLVLNAAILVLRDDAVDWEQRVLLAGCFPAGGRYAWTALAGALLEESRWPERSLLVRAFKTPYLAYVPDSSGGGDVPAALRRVVTDESAEEADRTSAAQILAGYLDVRYDIGSEWLRWLRAHRTGDGSNVGLETIIWHHIGFAASPDVIEEIRSRLLNVSREDGASNRCDILFPLRAYEQSAGARRLYDALRSDIYGILGSETEDSVFKADLLMNLDAIDDAYLDTIAVDVLGSGEVMKPLAYAAMNRLINRRYDPNTLEGLLGRQQGFTGREHELLRLRIEAVRIGR